MATPLLFGSGALQALLVLATPLVANHTLLAVCRAHDVLGQHTPATRHHGAVHRGGGRYAVPGKHKGIELERGHAVCGLPVAGIPLLALALAIAIAALPGNVLWLWRGAFSMQARITVRWRWGVDPAGRGFAEVGAAVQCVVRCGWRTR